MAKHICARDLRHLITIETPVNTRKSGGGSTTTWIAFVSNIRAIIKPLRGSEQFHGQQLEGPVTHKIITRYRSGVTPKHRIVFGTRTFNIRAAINVDEMNRWLEITAEERVAT